jgi:hypothetical protein
MDGLYPKIILTVAKPVLTFTRFGAVFRGFFLTPVTYSAFLHPFVSQQ